MQDSAVDNPRFLSISISNFLDRSRNAGLKKPSPVGANPSYAAATAIHADSGRYLFATRCAACHTIGHGVRIGPDLLGVTDVRDRSWMAHFIQKPDEMLAQKDPLALLLFKQYNQVQMPNLRLGSEDTQHLIQFLEAQSTAAHHGQNAGAKSALNGGLKPSSAN